MSKPNNTINKIKFDQSGTVTTKEALPTRLTDSTNLVELPPLSKDEFIIVSDSAISIPSVPTDDGQYILLSRVVESQVVFDWFSYETE